MRLEVLIDSEDPVIYPLDRPELVLGAADSCDIVLGSSGVSRKHLKILKENEKFFVVDQGSTNGTFVNEERLVPGRKVEFNSFFPVRLGDRVLLSLMSDEEAITPQTGLAIPLTLKKEPFLEETQVLSLKDLHKGSTEKLIKNRQDSIVKKKVVKKAKNSDGRMMKTILVTLFIAGAAIYFHFESLRNEANLAPVIEEVVIPVPPPAPKVVILKVATESLLPVDKINNLFKDLKCLIPEELYFCDLIPGLKDGNNGVASVGKDLIFLIEKNEPLKKARIIHDQHFKIKGKIQEDTEGNRDGVLKLAFLFFLKDYFLNLDIKAYLEYDFYFAFYEENEQKLEITGVYVIKGSEIVNLVRKVDKGFLDSYKQYGPKALIQLDEYFISYK